MDKVIEVERKRRLPDGGEALARLLASLGWRASEPVTETDVYYSRPDVDYMVTVECLRVRCRGDFTEITYKPPTTARTHADGVISKEETNVLLAAGQEELANQLLENIGMRRLVRVAKNRTVHRHAGHIGAVVAIDIVAGAGAFVETEVTGSDPAVAAELVERIEKRLDLLGYPMVELPYRDLVLAAGAGVASRRP
ncbi:class IV adenylate cyclase [Streptomyces albireticuli]|uniref:Adenylate cyclase n=1 Tax=Streptomyces albireticuli TaxID=1940 RepID=A0A2A2D0C8_9ACTN|nr:class IV adenylate cyclase [Streptomyces albireticuli]MCD9142759.1 class IV adenylate cyclase [Streptomyces albireticuli]MCD9162922.1 class IV adenylate cyclase [Streptomyces albireticuli]MCD9192482.1 class IV adenylate cyclase [Streptomyces albireticuli]PAU44965.1 adenylate cyclase [Streptomyces albireticuli]